MQNIFNYFTIHGNHYGICTKKPAIASKVRLSRRLSTRSRPGAIFQRYAQCTIRANNYAVFHSETVFFRYGARWFIMRHHIACKRGNSGLSRPMCESAHPQRYFRANIVPNEDIYKSIFVPTSKSLQFFLHVRNRTHPKTGTTKTALVLVIKPTHQHRYRHENIRAATYINTQATMHSRICIRIAVVQQAYIA